MANRSKQKGKEFEEYVASLIRKKWNLKKYECHRALSSGTYKVDYSDIVFNPDNFKRPHLVIECKKRGRNEFTYNTLIYPQGLIRPWIKQLNSAVVKYKKHFEVEPLPLLVMATDKMHPLVLIDTCYLKDLKVNPQRWNLQISEDQILLSEFFYRIGEKQSFYGIPLQDFLTKWHLISR